jgi:hypothetical protein
VTGAAALASGGATAGVVQAVNSVIASIKHHPATPTIPGFDPATGAAVRGNKRVFLVMH